MADNGQIDNVYLNFEVGGNANDEFDKMDKGLENIENNAKEAIEALESFANISKIDVLNKKLENVNKSLDEAVTKNKGLDDSGVLGDLTKRFSLVDKLAKETRRSAGYYYNLLLEEYLDDLEDIYLSQKILADIKSGKEKVYDWSDVKEMGNV